MDRVLKLVRFEEHQSAKTAVEYWLSRPPEERIAEVERLRLEYMENLGGNERHGASEGLPRSLRLIKRERR